VGRMAEDNYAELTISMRDIANAVSNAARDVAEVKVELKELNGSVRLHATAITILQEWRLLVAPMIAANVKSTTDLRVELAKTAALGTTIGTVIGGLMLIGKATGLF